MEPDTERVPSIPLPSPQVYMKSIVRVNTRKKILVSGILIFCGCLYFLLRGLAPQHSPAVPFPREYGTPLHRAVSTPRKLTDEDVRAMGTFIHSRDSLGQTPLMIAALRGDSGGVSLLLRHGARRYARDSEGRSPLMFALYSGSAETVALLADRKSVNIPSLDGIPPLVYARYFGNESITVMLLRLGAVADDRSDIMKSEPLWWHLWGEVNSTKGVLP
ncbi:MAG TPA: ankyrin repeat domain-containing protein [Spirochaetota bacterium]|mgnify:FL=1|nr:ankyrin repeat domain-containing protein [Spirochaetota bacterium]